MSTAATAKRPGAVARKPTLGSIFKGSLASLMETIGMTNAHYIRCIKPNEQKRAWEFTPQQVLSQLRACGVLETIRISCAGYPSRWTYDEFALRYVSVPCSSFGTILMVWMAGTTCSSHRPIGDLRQQIPRRFVTLFLGTPSRKRTSTSRVSPRSSSVQACSRCSSPDGRHGSMS